MIGALSALALAHGWCVGAIAQAMPSYRITRTISLGPPDRWDYLTFDAESGRVFAAHGDRVTVVDGRDGSIIGQVEGFPGGTHGVAVASRAGRGYSDDGKAGTATSFDLKTLRPLRTIKAGFGADGVYFDPFSRHVFVVNAESGSVTVIDPSSDTAVATIDVGGGLEFGAVDTHGKLYINGAERQEIVRIDTTTSRIDARWPVRNCVRPHGTAVDPLIHRVFVTCVNNVMVILDTDRGALLSTLPIGSRTDAAAFDPKRKLVFSSNGDGTLTVIAEKGPNQFVRLGDIPTALGARTMALDLGSGRIYLVTSDFTVNDNADPADARHRYVATPGTVHMLFLDPSKWDGFEMKENAVVKRIATKVPEVTLAFWFIKILATTLGETGGDAVTMSMNLGYLVGTAIFAVILFVAVTAQIAAKRFHPFLYWAVIIATTTAGTTMADFVDRSLGIGYLGGSSILLLLLLSTLGLWHWSLGSVSVDSLKSRKAEMFYWVTIMFSQTLGTALGDWMATSTGLGYTRGALVFAGGLALVAAAYFYTNISRTFLFWTAFILTRPLGATLGDFFDKPVADGGLDLSRYAASAVLAAVIIACVALLPQRAAKQRM